MKLVFEIKTIIIEALLKDILPKTQFYQLVA